jgi:hypothetical protein
VAGRLSPCFCRSGGTNRSIPCNCGSVSLGSAALHPDVGGRLAVPSVSIAAEGQGRASPTPTALTILWKKPHISVNKHPGL